MKLLRWGILLAFLSLAAGPALAADGTKVTPITVFAAASLSDILEEIGSLFTKETGIPVRINGGGSMALAQQIMKGAPADLFIPASNYALISLNRAHLTDAQSAKKWLSNSLVLIAPADQEIEMESPQNIALGDFKKIAIGDPQVVPAGKYAQQALSSLNLWDRVQSKLVPAANVRAALAYVESGEADLGIVYLSDARITPRVQVVLEFSSETHSAIRYPIALVARVGRAPGTRRLIKFLASPEAMEIAKRSGFTPDVH